MDGNSTDGTLDLIKKFEKEFTSAGIEFKWISEKDTGIYNAWNKGLRLASGEWLAFLGSDDQYLPNSLNSYAKVAEEHPDSDFICAKAKLFDGKHYIRPFGKGFNWNEFKNEMKILHAGSLHNAKYFEEFGEFDEDFKICGDYEILMRKGSKLNVHFIDQYLVLMQIGGVSTANAVGALKEARLAKLKNKIQGSLMSSIAMQMVLLKIQLGKLKRKLIGKAAS